ncbi:aminoacyl-tRNA hydrolase [Corynebacterium lipophiloflavum]|uniref:Peptidyl-tRNA hydrolase n=1 Tax=Corynebacterium lipophiloflavum (strain ATCC 700352 / DSM 44291 / CCUG 37336 / JCM 10383 / DMMZ 1944) TaxID=525263 RepID=C0XQ13_CORLD|nr:aminoacyl-tRNA hydrolase [Corynebacterium lipophiloflavum]EEI17657.1 aminoacyl-tRNA hydrolase [Corynebacterium lipophiloflavum DSM 44291]
MLALFRRLIGTGNRGNDAAQWLVVGLGNPGEEYAKTRHNVGWMALDRLLSHGGVTLRQDHAVKALVAVKDGIAYARPLTYMNESGAAVGPLAARLNVPAERVIVLHDELDLPPGRVRLRRGGSENGHNGLKSLSEHLGTRDYVRVRIGIGRPPGGTAVPDWVLSAVTGDVSAETEKAAQAARLVIVDGLERAQNQIHASR